jgi:acetyl esterase/lipase
MGQDFARDVDNRQCWRDPSYDIEEIGVISNMIYGEAIDPYTGEMQDLYLDAYFPPKFDDREARPLYIHVFGGGFMLGKKDMAHIKDLMGEVVSRGFVGVAVGYRLTGLAYPYEPEAPVLENVKMARDAVHDVRAAIRFMRKHADKARIDPGRVVVSGFSAGAMTVANLGYNPDFADEGESGNPGYSSAVQGVVPIAGMLSW